MAAPAIAMLWEDSDLSARRSLFPLAASLLLTFALAGTAAAHIDSKSILVETTGGAEECLESEVTTSGAACGAAVYTPDGFTGTINFTADEIGDTVSLVDYICVHTPGGGAFMSFAGSYTLTIDYDTGTTSTSYTVDGGEDCVDAANSVSDGFGSAVTFTVPADGTVTYWVEIAGVEPGTDAQQTFAGYNSILNRVVGDGVGHAHSASVKPPTTFIIPEAPLAILLLVSGGALATLLVARRMRRPGEVTAA